MHMIEIRFQTSPKLYILKNWRGLSKGSAHGREVRGSNYRSSDDRAKLFERATEMVLELSAKRKNWF